MEVRSMMRIASAKQKLSLGNEASGSNQQLSGKDKIKVLKLLKAKAAAENPPKVGVQPNQERIVLKIKEKEKYIEMATKKPNNFPIDISVVVANNNNNAVPDGFFDVPTIISEITPALKLPKEISSNTTTNIPAGFFDDPIEDLTARGLTIKQQILRQTEIENAELNTLLSEIDKIDEDTSALDAELEDEFNVRDFEDASIQMAYITKLAKLYKQSESVISKRGLGSSSNGTHMEGFESALKAAENESTMLLGTAVGADGVEVRGAATGKDSYHDIGKVVNEKLNEINAASKKRKLEEGDLLHRKIGEDSDRAEEDEEDPSDGEDSTGEYDPLQFM